MLFAKNTKVQAWAAAAIMIATLVLVLLFAGGTSAQNSGGTTIGLFIMAVVLIALGFLKSKG
jgi:hypothetical protein